MKTGRMELGRRASLGLLAGGAMARGAFAADARPITIGFAEAETGSLAAVGNPAFWR